MGDKYFKLHALMGDLTDPRSKRGIRHALPDVLFILLVSVISGIESADRIEDFVEENLDWFSTYCELRHGVPSQDTYGVCATHHSPFTLLINLDHNLDVTPPSSVIDNL